MIGDAAFFAFTNLKHGFSPSVTAGSAIFHYEKWLRWM
ncbi:hypothetical protein CFter6_4210 [Collimonas fungivorans]|uniref:Uncharacterized protein n=1 Tax=Collimonas fungivorans TaxID=158899 RepID=A0A127PHD5_9BURK|nr:hypothetical protein CFter6_4210 [Collimonas fungivorans]